LGGVLLTTQTDFENANGFSNEYWGWGHEDDDLFLRFLVTDVKIERKPGLYISLPHKPSSLSIESAERFIKSLIYATRQVNDPAVMTRIKKAVDLYESRGTILPHWHRPAEDAKDYMSDGLSTLKYDLLSCQPLKEFMPFDSEIPDSHEIVRVRL
jgi:hypothetical protein